MDNRADHTTLPLRSLGNSDIQISALGLGSWNTYAKSVNNLAQVKQIVHRAHEHGINFFDMADSYAAGKAEEMMGAALQGLPRDAIIISSKTCFPIGDDRNDRGLSRKRILVKIEDSLRRIGTDYLDLYFCHRYDPDTPLEETVMAMNDLIKQGKIRHWGTSEWSSRQIREAQRLAQKHGLIPPLVEQPELNLVSQLKFKQDTQPEASRYNLGMVTFSPLASGILSGKYDNGVPRDSRLDQIPSIRKRLYTEHLRQKVLALRNVADALNCSRAQLSIAWAMAQPGVSSVITGASRLEQLTENLGAAQIQLTPEVSKQLDTLFAPNLYRVIRYKTGRLLRNLRSK